jgi:t-SNARE complex subunit (syntaxin)
VQVFQEGQTIKHEQYGLGVVTASDVDRTTIEFDDFGRKLFVTSLMSAEVIGEAPAPLSKSKRRRKQGALKVRKAVANR